MGNMSNPSINRWGLNLFWYKHWFTDKNYHLSVQHDLAINKLVYTFLNFGILFPVNIFLNKYWLSKSKNINYYNEHNTKYYRVMSFKNLITLETSYYNQRIKIENVYQSKIWILKFQHWVMINFYCFNPIKKRDLASRKKIKHGNSDIFLTKSEYRFENYKRMKLVFFYFVKKISRSNFYYKF